MAWTVNMGSVRRHVSRRLRCQVHGYPSSIPNRLLATLAYLSLAERSLTDSTEMIGQIAQSIGYKSVSAFGKVFAKATKYSLRRIARGSDVQRGT